MVIYLIKNEVKTAFYCVFIHIFLTLNTLQNSATHFMKKARIVPRMRRNVHYFYKCFKSLAQ